MSNAKGPKPPKGFFVTEGMEVSLNDFHLSSIDDKIEFCVDLKHDPCVSWAEISYRNLRQARLNGTELQRSFAARDTRRAEFLANEYFHCLQAVVAAATSIDALYDILKPYTRLSTSEVEAWKAKGTPRHAQVSEVIRRATSIRNEDAKEIRRYLAALYQLRGAALHPSGKPYPPRFHPELNINTDWRLVAYRGAVAEIIVTTGMRLLWNLAESRSQCEEVKSYFEFLREHLMKFLPEVPPPIQGGAKIDVWIPPRR